MTDYIRKFKKQRSEKALQESLKRSNVIVRSKQDEKEYSHLKQRLVKMIDGKTGAEVKLDKSTSRPFGVKNASQPYMVSINKLVQ